MIAIVIGHRHHSKDMQQGELELPETLTFVSYGKKLQKQMIKKRGNVTDTFYKK